MKDFVRVATVSPNLRVADPFYNVEEMLKWVKEAEKEAVSLLVYPELAVSGYTANDLLLQESLQEACKKALGIFPRKRRKALCSLSSDILWFIEGSCLIRQWLCREV